MSEVIGKNPWNSVPSFIFFLVSGVHRNCKIRAKPSKSHPEQGAEVNHQQRWLRTHSLPVPAGCHLCLCPLKPLSFTDPARSLLSVSCGRVPGDKRRTNTKLAPEDEKLRIRGIFPAAGQGQAEGGPGTPQTVPSRPRSPDR